MKRVLIAGAMLSAPTNTVFADGLYWVIGNRATAQCEIVTSNPVINGDIWFADGPYRSAEEAKLARSTIHACPIQEPSREDESAEPERLD